jgi:LysM repeat protein
VTDETPRKRRPPAAADGQPTAADGATPGSPNDPDAALERLASLGGGASVEPTPVPPDPAVSAYASPPSRGEPRPIEESQRVPRSRPRAAGGSSSGRTVVRIAAPVVFLVAVIALVGIVVQSGVMNGSAEPTVTPTVKATKATTATKKYVIQSGDSLSSIAERFGTTIDVLVTLNPDLSPTTLRVGTRIVVPRK